MMGTVVLLKNNEMTVIEDICEADFRHEAWFVK